MGGGLGLMTAPTLLATRAAGRHVALISGTNGKTTTTRLTAAALGVLGEVATNSLGANMPTGHTSALARAGDTPYAVLEVDEHYLPQVLAATNARVTALLNLSRDQLDRAKEVAMMAQLWRDTLRGQDVQLVANADDPMVTWAARDSATVTWVAAGQRWHDDSWVCPECGGAIARGDAAAPATVGLLQNAGTAPPTGLAGAAPVDGVGAPAEGGPGLPEVASGGGEPDLDWACTRCDLRRPRPQWTLSDTAVIGPDGHAYPVRLQLPGRVNRANAATALAVAALFGADPAQAAPRLSQVASIAGRYAQVQRDGRAVRLLLAKNPAGWLEAFEMAEDAPTLLSINARDPDGLDTSWLFDVDFAPLAGRRVLITGDRAYDLAVRLEVNRVPFQHVTTFAQALSAVPPGRLEVIANYTAFQDIRAELDRVN